mgnify:CR=1 FL=1
MRLAILGSPPPQKLSPLGHLRWQTRKSYIADDHQLGLWDTRVSWENCSYKALVERV